MKKYLVLFVLLLVASASFSQNSERFVKGCFEDKIWKFCSYEEAYLKNDMAGTVLLDKFEVGYDKTSKIYSIYVKFDTSIVNADVKFTRGSSSDGYLYDGIDRISGQKVSVFCRNKLSLYTQNYGVTSKAFIKEYEKEGINLIFPKTYTISSVVPVKNK